MVWIPASFAACAPQHTTLALSQRESHTRSASSTDPCTMLVQVRCITVSIPYSFCVNDASSSVRSLVDPPAPHVILIARGFRSAKRDIRRRRLLKPCVTRHRLHEIDHVTMGLAYLFGSRWEELESIERPAGLFELFRKLHSGEKQYMYTQRSSEEDRETVKFPRLGVTTANLGSYNPPRRRSQQYEDVRMRYGRRHLRVDDG